MITKLPDDRGDSLSLEAIDELYSTQAREIWAVFYSKCSNYTLADDVLSESFTRLVAYRGRIRNPRAWLINVGKNLLIDHLRREQRCQTQHDQRDLPSRPAAPDQDLLQSEVRNVVRESLCEMREDYRLVLVLRYGLGYSTKRISAMMDNSVAAADMRLSRARRRLAELLHSRGIDNATDLDMGTFVARSPRSTSHLVTELVAEGLVMTADSRITARKVSTSVRPLRT